MEADTVPHPNEEGQGSPVVLYVMLASFFIWAMTRRTSRTKDLPEDCAGIWLYGRVTGVADGDGFWFYDCPWLRSRSYSNEDGKLRVRLAGIDAPEMGSSNRPGQRFAKESKVYLGNLIRGKSIRIKVVGVDQYDRVLAVAYLPRQLLRPFFNRWWFPISIFDWLLSIINSFGLIPIKLFKWYLEKNIGWSLVNFSEWFLNDFFYINVNLKMVENGYACVYKGRDAIYDKYKESFLSLQKKAKREKKSMWMFPNPETPMSYKRKYRQ